MIYEVKGNLLGSSCDYICHQVNCQGVMGAGLAKQIKELWPQVYINYRDKYEAHIWSNLYSYQMLGDIQICSIDNEQYVVNLFAQDNYGRDNKRYTSYDAFWICLNKLKSIIKSEATIAFPKNIGCGLGGANWQVIRTMIDEVFKNYEVYIYEL